MTPETLSEIWKQEEDKCKMLKAKYTDVARQKGVHVQPDSFCSVLLTLCGSSSWDSKTYLLGTSV